MSNIDETTTTKLAHRNVITPAPTGAFTVSVIEGPDRGKQIEIDGLTEGPALLGSSPACQLRLADPLVSRRHVSFEAVQRGLRMTDAGSTNGTFIGQLRVNDVTLVGGETIRIGDSTLSIERKAAPQVALPPVAQLGGLLGMSREMRRLYPMLERLAASDVAVLVEGETGTGKEALAETLHRLGKRAKGPFVVVDCATLAPERAMSELFGHERGAFPGADDQRKGVFERANGGTILIDEIGDLDLALQPKLLRVLERGEIQRVGADASIQVDVRIISATRRDLDREVQDGRFRDDLFHRLVVARVELPPLRQRRGDVSLLAKHFAQELGGLGTVIKPEILTRWEEQSWPGNVRELRNAVARELVLGGVGLDVADLEGALDEPSPPPDAAAPAPPAVPTEGVIEKILALNAPLLEARQRLVEDFDRAYLSRALREHGGNVTRAAASSGIARRNFQLLRARRGI